MTQPLSSHGTLLELGDGVGTIGAVAFTGTGTDDMIVSSPEAFYDGHLDVTVLVEIEAAGTPDTFRYSLDGGATWERSGIPISGASTPILLQDGLYVEFGTTTGHTLGDQWEFDASADYTTLAEVVDISGPSFSQSVFDAPSQEVTWQKRVAGIVSAGEVSFGLNFIPKEATHDDSTGVLSRLGSMTDGAFRLRFNDAGTGTRSEWRFSGYLTGFEHDLPVDGIAQANVTIQINGQPTFLQGTS